MNETVTGIIKVLEFLGPIVGMLTGTGLLVKYAPFMKWFPNEAIRVLNALIVFFGFLGGAAPAPAEAGILGDLVAHVGVFGKIGAAVAISSLSSWLYEKWLRDPLDKLGVKKPA